MKKTTRILIAVIVFLSGAAVYAEKAADAAAIAADPASDEKVLELIAKSEFEASLNFNDTVLKNRVESNRQKPFCAQSPKCLKALEDFERDYNERKPELKAKAVEQLKNELKQKFTAKQVQLLLKVMESSVYRDFNQYVKVESAEPYIQFHQPFLEKLRNDVDKATNPSLNK